MLSYGGAACCRKRAPQSDLRLRRTHSGLKLLRPTLRGARRRESFGRVRRDNSFQGDEAMPICCLALHRSWDPCFLSEACFMALSAY